MPPPWECLYTICDALVCLIYGQSQNPNYVMRKFCFKNEVQKIYNNMIITTYHSWRVFKSKLKPKFTSSSSSNGVVVYITMSISNVTVEKRRQREKSPLNSKARKQKSTDDHPGLNICKKIFLQRKKCLQESKKHRWWPRTKCLLHQNSWGRSGGRVRHTFTISHRNTKSKRHLQLTTYF